LPNNSIQTDSARLCALGETADASVKFLINETMTRKRFLITILVLAGLYFLILPLLWPEPKIAISVSSDDHSLYISEATVTVHTWHSNIALFTVNGIFNVDRSKNNGNAVIAKNLLPEKNQKRWDSLHTLGINRWTCNFRIELPIEELRNKTDLDYVTGRIYVRLRYPDVWEGFTITSEATLVEKVKIMLWE
jgi:hypothetical protein